MDQLGKIRQHRWKEHLQIKKLAKFWKWYVLKERRYRDTGPRKVAKIWGQVWTSVKFRDFEEQYLYKLDNIINLKALSSLESTDFS